MGDMHGAFTDRAADLSTNRRQHGRSRPVYGVTPGGDGVATTGMTLTSAACPLTDVIEEQAASALEGLATDFRIT
jgi:hypothetical protein